MKDGNRQNNRLTALQNDAVLLYLYNIILTLNLIVMISSFNTSEPLNYVQTFPENLENTPPFSQNLLEKSEIAFNSIDSERFTELNSFSLKNFNLISVADTLGSFSNCYDQHCLSDPLYNVVSLRRGKSQVYMEDEDKINLINQYFIEQHTTLIDLHLFQDKDSEYQIVHSQMDLDSLPRHQQSEGESKNLHSTSNEAQENLKVVVSTKGKFSTKNVTKNMGKLLFKFIWKNRMTLRKHFQIQNEEWQSFLTQICICKKENNITRDFLNTRWHSHGKNSKIFRIISHHFFRKRCLSAIIQSNINCKEIHTRRLRRFLEAVSNPKALDSLN